MTEKDPCPICAGPTDVLLELDASWVTAGSQAPLPGYVCVVARTHAVEPFELGGLERHRYFEELWRVAAALREYTGAAKINYEIHGNTIPHLHTHLYPRFAGDPFTGRPIDGSALLFERNSAELSQLTATIRRDADASRGLRTFTSHVHPVDAYDQMAPWVDEHFLSGFYNAHYDRPAVLELVGEIAGQRVLDVGCGPGHYLGALLERGAHPVGIDGSAELLERARGHLGQDIPLICHDLNKPLEMLVDESFDGVVCALVYHHIDQRTQLLCELRRVLRPGGWLLLSTTHPFADWLDSGGSYFATERTEAVFDRSGRQWRVPFWRIPLGALLDEVLGAELYLERLVEPVPPPAAREVNERLYRRLTNEPGFVVVKARRPR